LTLFCVFSSHHSGHVAVSHGGFSAFS
jgi:hypothetical protein